MNSNRKKQIGLLLILVVIAGLFAFVQLAAADDPVEQVDANNMPQFGRSWKVRMGPRVLPPARAWYGRTYDVWAAEWWQWATDLEADDNHPLKADGAMDCSLGQHGKVWFLGGSYAPGPDPDNTTEPYAFLGEADRECEIPAGKALFFPIVNVLCSDITGDGPPEDLVGCAADPPPPPGFEVEITPLSATIDGKQIRNLKKYYTLSEEPFKVGPLPYPNIVENLPDYPAPLGTEGSGATGGYYLLLPPLSEGEHLIEFEGEIVIPELYSFRLDISYDLTVVGD